MVMLAPSILSADFANLLKDIKEVETAGADMLHIDVMDGHFVPNISIGLPVVKSIKKVTKLPLDVHLMILNPERYIDDFISAGANYITVHAEACFHLHRLIESIRALGAKPSVALNPATSLNDIEYIIDYIDMVLIMTVNPGFGGQNFIKEMVYKINRLKKMILKRNLDVKIQVDGGINLDNVEEVVKAGADIIVAGSAIFRADSIENTVFEFKEKISRIKGA
ncbi:MAG TPA: ribulose-phosphate 3-epimerase [Thermoanaerobacterales bacterium]|nr:ribulose-phosphate 3-epimerase [Thermoanaerobacterales bacterium]